MAFRALEEQWPKFGVKRSARDMIRQRQRCRLGRVQPI
jgi:hypothetical protein